MRSIETNIYIYITLDNKILNKSYKAQKQYKEITEKFNT